MIIRIESLGRYRRKIFARAYHTIHSPWCLWKPILVDFSKMNKMAELEAAFPVGRMMTTDVPKGMTCLVEKTITSREGCYTMALACADLANVQMRVEDPSDTIAILSRDLCDLYDAVSSLSQQELYGGFALTVDGDV